MDGRDAKDLGARWAKARFAEERAMDELASAEDRRDEARKEMRDAALAMRPLLGKGKEEIIVPYTKGRVLCVARMGTSDGEPARVRFIHTSETQ